MRAQEQRRHHGDETGREIGGDRVPLVAHDPPGPAVPCGLQMHRRAVPPVRQDAFVDRARELTARVGAPGQQVAHVDSPVRCPQAA